jgi:hypothetical protein
MTSCPRSALSEVIGAIWPATIGAICRATDCCAGLIAVTNLDPPEVRLLQA